MPVSNHQCFTGDTDDEDGVKLLPASKRQKLQKTPVKLPELVGPVLPLYNLGLALLLRSPLCLGVKFVFGGRGAVPP